jgi:hypothetical protein
VTPQADTSPELARENRLTLYVVQALLGLVTSNVVAVSAEVASDYLAVHFWLREESAETEGDIEEILVGIDAFMGSEPVRLDSRVHIGVPPDDWQSWAGRMVHWAKDEG